MSEPFIAEVRIWALNFAPRGWAFCNGQLLPIAQNTALFSLVGTIYGGDGRTSFGLPDLQGRAAMHPGRGPGLTDRRLGERGGAATATLTEAQMPSHTHKLQASTSDADSSSPAGNVPAKTAAPVNLYRTNPGGAAFQDTAMETKAAGGGQPHNNMQPYLGLNFCIALVGLYPSRS
jgi:microcystin-dependent protein